jgi:ribose 5-phosphate isomerase A
MDALKKQVGILAARLVPTGVAVGLGTGSTATHFVRALSARLRDEPGFTVALAVTTSEATLQLARELGNIPLFEDGAGGAAPGAPIPRLAIAVDGADEVDTGTLHLIKGAGGALLREKMVELRADRLVIVADGSKTVAGGLGTKFAVPVEVVRFDHAGIAAQLRDQFACEPVLRARGDGAEPYVTDNGNFILDCRFPQPIVDVDGVGARLKAVTGVVEHGLFVGMATTAIVAAEDGTVTTYERDPATGQVTSSVE